MKKAIIFDCDNTLWHGVVGEDTIWPKVEYQKDILFLAEHGVIIGLCSKNNEVDILETLKSQLLTEDYISVKRINWKDKVSNICDIAQELNIGLDSIVFVDDSPFEINMVAEALPEVMCIYPDDLLKTVGQYFNLSGDFTKTIQYKQQYERAKYAETFTDTSQYLESLDMILSIKKNDKSQVKRLAELTQKTNQFNLTTERLTVEQVKGLMPWVDIYTLSVKDRFGDSGLTGVCIINNNKIDNFLLSCRILGRGIEYAFMDYILKDIKSVHIFGRYVPSAKNIQVAEFYDRLGFEYLRSNGSGKIYYQILKDYKRKSQNHFRYE